MDIGTLISVVAMLEAEKKRGLKLIEDKDIENLSYTDEFAVSFHIAKLEDLIEHFQGYIESMVSAMESAQGE